MKDSFHKTLTFMDIPNREWALHTPEALALRQYVADEKKRPDIWEDIETVFLKKGVKSAESVRVIEWFDDNSFISRSVISRPSDAEPFDQIYRYAEPTCEIDRFYIQSKGAIGIYLRLMAMIDRLPDIIRSGIKNTRLAPGERYRILDVGCGYGDAIREVLSRNRDLAEKVMVYGVDIDENSTKNFKERVERDGLSASFSIHTTDMKNFQPIQAHLTLVIGMLCPVPGSICIRILKNLRFHSAGDGIIIYSTVQTPMVYEDPLLDAFMRGLNWPMDFKTESEAKLIGEASGWKIISYFDDALGYNRMSIGTLRPERNKG